MRRKARSRDAKTIYGRWNSLFFHDLPQWVFLLVRLEPHRRYRRLPGSWRLNYAPGQTGGQPGNSLCRRMAPQTSRRSKAKREMPVCISQHVPPGLRSWLVVKNIY